MLQLLRLQCPKLLWIRLAGPCAGSGNKRDSSRAQHLIALAQLQQTLQGAVVVEANARSQVWHLQSVQGLTLGLSVTKHSWCQYHVDLEDPKRTRCSSVVQIASNCPLDNAECKCPEGMPHCDSKQLGRNKDYVWFRVLTGIVRRAVNTATQGLLHRQPEFDLEQRRQQLMAAPTPIHGQAEQAEPIGTSQDRFVQFLQKEDPSKMVESFPTEQALRRKAALASGHQPTKKNIRLLNNMLMIAVSL